MTETLVHPMRRGIIQMLPISTERVVGARGFEPPTPCAQGRCATRLRYAPRAVARARSQEERNSGKMTFNFSRARARWLIRFFSSGSSSAMVLPNWGTKKIGSYPKPRFPRGARVIHPEHSPSTTSIRPPGSATAMAHTNRACLFPSGMEAISSNNF